MLLNIVTPTKNLLQNAEVEEVIVPAFRGELGILPGHSPLISTLDTGVMKYRLAGESEFKKVVISWGYLEVGPDTVNVLSETAEDPYEIDLHRAVKAITESEKMLAEGDITLADMEKYQRKLKRGSVRKLMAEEANGTKH